MNGDAILAAVLSLREATEHSFNRIEGEMDRRFNQIEGEMGRRFNAVDTRLDALETRLDRFEVKVLHRFDDLEGRLIAVESR
jgi:hypothetical protein